MQTSTTVLIGVGAYAGIMLIEKFAAKNAGLQAALAWSGTYGIINVGSGYGWGEGAERISELPQVKANVDVDPLSNGCPNYQRVDLELGGLPFIDGQFDVAFASHVLEHIRNWQTCLNECQRVANHVVVVLPNPLWITTYFNRLHVNQFTFSDMAAMKSDKVEVYC